MSRGAESGHVSLRGNADQAMGKEAHQGAGKFRAGRNDCRHSTVSGMARRRCTSTQEGSFVTNESKTNLDIEPTAMERLAILEALWRRNKIRAIAQLPRLDVPTEFFASIQRLRNKKFDRLLKPFLDQAMATTPGTPGIAGRLKQRLEAVRLAEAGLLGATGIRRPAGASPVLLRDALGICWARGSNEGTTPAPNPANL